MLAAGVSVRLPSHEQGLSQAEEYLLLEENGAARKIRFHDYDQIFAVPGLYELVFSEMLRCASPEVVKRRIALPSLSPCRTMINLPIVIKPTNRKFIEIQL